MKIFIPKKKYLFLIFFFSFLLLPVISLAALNLNLEYPSFEVGGDKFDLNATQHINQVVVWFYYFIVTLAGFAAFVMLVWGGIEWLISAGNPTKTSSAKERITSAITGLLIILISFLILQTINPELTTLTFPETQEASPWPDPAPDPEPVGVCDDVNGTCRLSILCNTDPDCACYTDSFECSSPECCGVPPKSNTCSGYYGFCAFEASECNLLSGYSCRNVIGDCLLPGQCCCVPWP